MVKETKAEVSRKRVLDAAARIFRDNGYTGTTMRAIGDSLNIKAGSIYYHYSSKDDLISAVLDVGIQAVTDRVTAALAAMPETATGREKLGVAVRAHLSAIIEVGDYTLATRRVMGQVPEAIRMKNMRQREVYTKIWRKILTDGQASGEFRASASFKSITFFIFGALNWTVEWFRPTGDATVEQVAAEFTSLVLDGLVDDGESTPRPKPKKAGA